MKEIYFCFIICCFSLLVHAQNLSPDFAIGASSYNGGTRVITTDSSQNIWAIINNWGATIDVDPGVGLTTITQPAILKYDNNGNLLFAKQLQPTAVVNIKSMTVDKFQNIWIVGEFNADLDADPGAGTFNLTSIGNYDFFLAKYDNNGNFLWAGSTGTLNNNDIINFVASDSSGNIWITGEFYDVTDFDLEGGVFNMNNPVSGSSYLAKYNNNGNFLWAGLISGSFATNTGNSIAVDSAQNIWLTGAFNNTTDFDPNVGVVNLNSLQNDTYLAKYDNSGNFLWAGAMPCANHDAGRIIKYDPKGYVWIVGSTEGGGILDLDPNAGNTNYVGNGLNDGFIAKYDLSGNYIWSGFFSSASTDDVFSFAFDTAGSVYIAGYFGDLLDFNKGAAVYNLFPTATTEIFIAKYDNNGNFLWAKNFQGNPGTGQSSAGTIEVDIHGNIWAGGSFQDTVDFDPGPDVLNLFASTSGGGFWFGKYTKCAASNATSAITNASDPYTNDGQVSVASDGNPPYSYQWDAAAGGQTSALATGLYSGNYCVTVTNGPWEIGCLPDTNVHCITINAGAPYWTMLNIPRFTAFQGVTALNNNPMHLRFSVYDSVTTDTLWCGMYYKETNSFGAFSLKINNEFDFPNPIATTCGGLATTFPDVPWHTGNKWMRIQYESNIGSGFTQSWALQLNSLFYAFSSRYAERIPHWFFENGDTIAHNGNVNIYGSSLANAHNTPSDLRYKKDITPIPNAWASLTSIRGVKYQYKPEAFEKDKQPSTDTQIGLIAQEVEKIYPEMVQTNSAGYKTVDYTKLTPVLLEAIKERQGRIEKMQADNAARREAIEELKKLNASINSSLEIITISQKHQIHQTTLEQKGSSPDTRAENK